MKLENTTINQLNALPAKQRERVDVMVRDHVAACLKNGIAPENLDRVYIEAMEMTAKPEEAPVVEFKREPRRRYDVYVAPKGA